MEGNADVWITWLALGDTGSGKHGLWRLINEAFGDSDAFSGSDDVLMQIAQNMARGEFEIPVTVEDWSGNTATGSITITIVDMQIPLETGWNLRSTPISLEDGEWTADWLDDSTVADAILKYDSELGFVLSDNSLDPLEGVYIHMLENDQLDLVWSKDPTPIQRSVGADWNLIGPATFDNFMNTDDALVSVLVAPGGDEDLTGYTTVISIDQDVDYEEDWVYTTVDGVVIDLSDDKLEGSTNWVFFQGSEPWTDVPAPNATPEQMYVGRGYWLFMENDDELSGFSVTPVIYCLEHSLLIEEVVSRVSIVRRIVG